MINTNKRICYNLLNHNIQYKSDIEKYSRFIYVCCECYVDTTSFIVLLDIFHSFEFLSHFRLPFFNFLLAFGFVNFFFHSLCFALILSLICFADYIFIRIMK